MNGPRTPPARWLRAMAVAALIGLGLAVAWLWPPAAVVTVWPFLVVVPGWTVVGWACRGRARVSGTGRAGLAIVLSVAGSAHLAWWLATVAGGYERWTVFAAAALLATPLPVAAAGAPAGGAVRRLAGGIGRTVRRYPAAVGLAGGTIAFVGAVLARGLWQVELDGVYVGGSNWSDLGVHLGIAESVNAGNFPPDVPYFAGEPLVYHWFADFHAALLAASAELFAVPVFVGHSALLAGALALIVHGLARALVRDRWARRAAVLAVVMAIFTGGLGWIRLVGDVAAGEASLWDLLMTHAYDNQWLTGWPYFSIPSVMTTGLLVHRATAAGLPLAVGAVLLAVAALPPSHRRRLGDRDRARLLLVAGLAGALLAPFHFFFFPAVPLLVLGWVALGGRLIERAAVRHAALFAAPYLLAIPFAAPAFGQATGSGWLSVVPGWQTAPFGEGPGAVLFFYATNLGIPFALAIVALAWRQAPARAFLAFWVVTMFLVPNVVQVSYVSFDMNKYFQLMWIGVAVLAGWLLARRPRLVVAAVLAVSMLSPILASVHTAFSRNYLMSRADLAAGEWIAAATPERSVFVTDDWIIAPTDPAGRLRLAGFSAYVANLGFDPTARLAAIEQIRCGGDPAASAQLMRELGATYVIPATRACAAPVDFAASPLFEPAYEEGGVRIFRLSSGP